MALFPILRDGELTMVALLLRQAVYLQRNFWRWRMYPDEALLHCRMMSMASMSGGKCCQFFRCTPTYLKTSRGKCRPWRVACESCCSHPPVQLLCVRGIILTGLCKMIPVMVHNVAFLSSFRWIDLLKLKFLPVFAWMPTATVSPSRLCFSFCYCFCYAVIYSLIWQDMQVFVLMVVESWYMTCSHR